MVEVLSSDGRLIDYVEIIDHRKSIIYVSQNNLKIDYFLSINQFYSKFSYNSLFYSASSCCSHFGATSYQLFAPRDLDSIPCGVMFIFSQIFDNFPTKIVMFFCKNRQIFLHKLSNFLTKIVKIFLCKSSNFPLEIVKFSWKICQIFLQKFSDHLAQIVKFSFKNR